MRKPSFSFAISSSRITPPPTHTLLCFHHHTSLSVLWLSDYIYFGISPACLHTTTTSVCLRCEIDYYNIDYTINMSMSQKLDKIHLLYSITDLSINKRQ